MTHAYRQPIAVTPAADGRPAVIDWRGVAYRVLEVFGSWHLRDGWWEGEGAGASDRTYYRLRCRSASAQTELVCEVYCDAVRDAWVLERIYD